MRKRGVRVTADGRLLVRGFGYAKTFWYLNPVSNYRVVFDDWMWGNDSLFRTLAEAEAAVGPLRPWTGGEWDD